MAEIHFLMLAPDRWLDFRAVLPADSFLEDARRCGVESLSQHCLDAALSIELEGTFIG